MSYICLIKDNNCCYLSDIVKKTLFKYKFVTFPNSSVKVVYYISILFPTVSSKNSGPF